MSADRGRVGIIGAGVAGLATARRLTRSGYDCVLFERNAGPGGVWADGYVNFGVQVHKELYQFPDWPLPETTPNFTPGPDFRRYLEDFAAHFGIRERIYAGCRVLALEPHDGGRAGWTVLIERNGEKRRERFDLIVAATGLYSEKPAVPDIPGRERFEGEVRHASQVKSREVLADRKVVVVGYGKSASDIALEAADVAQASHLVFRKTHWPVPRKLAGILPFKWGLLNRLTASLIIPYVRPRPIDKWIHGIGAPLVWAYWRLVELLLQYQWGLGTRIKGGLTLVPDTPVEIDCFGESTMVPRPDFFESIRRRRIIAHRSGIRSFSEGMLELDNGERIEADCVVFGTGWQLGYEFLPAAVKDALGRDDDGFYLYRHILHPDVPNLFFIGRASTFLSVTTYCLQARWLAELLERRIVLPSRADMLVEIDRLKNWKRSWMPYSSHRGARVLLHMHNYHDELLTDIGEAPWRKRGVFAPFKEVFAPYQSSDYAAVV